VNVSDVKTLADRMRAEIGKERVEQIMRIAVAIEIDGEFAGFAFEQFRRRVVLLKIDEHGLSVPSFRIAANGSGPKWPPR